jgi:hypothetical protein
MALVPRHAGCGGEDDDHQKRAHPLFFFWIPVFVLMCLAEEWDTLLRYSEAYEEYRKNTGFMLPRVPTADRARKD